MRCPNSPSACRSSWLRRSRSDMVVVGRGWPAGHSRFAIVGYAGLFGSHEATIFRYAIAEQVVFLACILAAALAVFSRRSVVTARDTRPSG